ncbi:tryptophan halogenase family protein [Paraglaciecola aestuariivivens]
MSPQHIKKIVILGGGTAGWMAAAALAKYIRYPEVNICLVESDAIGTVGVGEATIPGIKEFNRQLGIDEQAFMRATQASIKLGIEFSDWAAIGDKYLHPFGNYGHDLNALPFYHYWLKQQAHGDTSALADYCIPCIAAEQGKFSPPNSDPRSVLSTFFNAYHLDAGLYANFLRDIAQQEGVKRIEGKVIQVKQTQDGMISELLLDNQQRVEGELFIDCSGFKALLIGQNLASDFEDWSKWLPANSAIAVPTARPEGNIRPFTQAIAHPSGWQWRIPLQHRTGNGMVYSTDFMDDSSAHDLLLSKLESPTLTDAQQLKFQTGMRTKQWHKNCVAIGLSGGFVEPLESTSIHLIQTGIMKLIQLFPNKSLAQCKIDEYNSEMAKQFTQVRDFIILHYKATQRTDSEFWRHCQNMPIPDSLASRIELFKETGQIRACNNELFIETNWLAVLLGQNIQPKSYHPRADNLAPQQLQQVMRQIAQTMQQAVAGMPSHADFIQRYCAAN